MQSRGRRNCAIFKESKRGGKATYNARVGAHDDLILAVAIALWFSTNMPRWSHEELVF
jgi:hypothetical protein